MSNLDSISQTLPSPFSQNTAVGPDYVIQMGRPKPRRTISAPDVEAENIDTDKMDEDRSPTPPPLPGISTSLQSRITHSTQPTPTQNQSANMAQISGLTSPVTPSLANNMHGEAGLFASLIYQAIHHPVNSKIVQVLENQFGVKMDSLYGFAGEWYERLKLQQGIEDINLGRGRDVTSAESSVCLNSTFLSSPHTATLPEISTLRFLEQSVSVISRLCRFRSSHRISIHA
jgi:hypothetical protein